MRKLSGFGSGACVSWVDDIGSLSVSVRLYIYIYIYLLFDFLGVKSGAGLDSGLAA